MARKQSTQAVEDNNDSDFFKDILKIADNEYAEIVDEMDGKYDLISTGSMSLNGLLSGSLGGGFRSNKVLVLAGEPSTGKTFYTLSLANSFLNDNPEGIVIYFETEHALDKDQIQARVKNSKRVILVPVSTVQEFRTQALKILQEYLKKPVENRKPMMYILDSLGNLSTTKEMEDISAGKETKDMTRAQLIKAAFRVLRLTLSRANVTMIVTNHVYDVIGSYVPMKKMNGGSGAEYAGDQILFLTKSYDNEEDDDGKNQAKGAIITALLKKSRITIEKKKVKTLLNFEKGLDPYYGLLDLAVKFGIFKKGSKTIELPDGTSEYKSRIESNPQKYFTKEVLLKIDEACKEEFLYGNTNVTEEEEEE